MLTVTQQRDRADKLLAKLQECENECHAIGFTKAAHSINAAKNAVGWDLADVLAQCTTIPAKVAK